MLPAPCSLWPSCAPFLSALVTHLTMWPISECSCLPCDSRDATNSLTALIMRSGRRIESDCSTSGRGDEVRWWGSKRETGWRNWKVHKSSRKRYWGVNTGEFQNTKHRWMCGCIHVEVKTVLKEEGVVHYGACRQWLQDKQSFCMHLGLFKHNCTKCMCLSGREGDREIEISATHSPRIKARVHGGGRGITSPTHHALLTSDTHNPLSLTHTHSFLNIGT